MSLALYRKYRPATFAELKGQEHVAEPLQQALRNGRINHAYLFSGPRGCGKTSSARILARSLNCEQGPTPEPCGKCDSCVALGPGGNGHIDVIEIDAASHGGVDDARDLRERAFFAPVASRFKVYIIDEAHMVSREGFNALLKLVEEPPPHLKFIFATTEPEKVIGTIRSRTHHYPFRLVPPGTLRELVEEILRSEDVPYEAPALPLVVRAGAGSARDTLSILDQLLAGANEAGITYARAVSLLGYTDASLLDEVVDAFAAGDGASVFAAIDRVIESGQDPRRFAADLLERVRDLVILSNVPEAGATGLLDAPPDELEQMQRQASGMGAGELTRAADLLHTGLTEMRGATSPRLLLELICARILLPGAYEDESSMFARLERLERRIALGGVAQPAPAGDPGQQGPAAQGRSMEAPSYRQSSAGQSAAAGGPQRQADAPGGQPPSRSSAETQRTASAGSSVDRGSAASEVERRSVDNSESGNWPRAARPSGGAGQGHPGVDSPSQAAPGPSGTAPGAGAARESGAASGAGAEHGGEHGSATAPGSGTGQGGQGAGAAQSAGAASGSGASQAAGAGPGSGTRQGAAASYGAGAASGSGAGQGAGTGQGAGASQGAGAASGSVAARGSATGQGTGTATGSGAGQGSGAPRGSGAGQRPGGAHGSGGAQGSGGAGNAGAAQRGATPLSQGGFDVAAVRRSWPDILEAVKQKSRVAWMTVMSGVQVVSLEGNLLTLSFEAEGTRKNFSNGGRDVVLREVLKEFLGVDWRIDTVLGSGGSPARPGDRPAQAVRPQAPAPEQPPPPAGFGSAATSAPARPAATPGGGGGGQSAVRPRPEQAPPPPDDPPPPTEPPPPVDESEEVDPEGDADADGTEAEVSGMALIQRELGGQIIREIDNT